MKKTMTIRKTNKKEKIIGFAVWGFIIALMIYYFMNN
ncbi:hypothetical protein [Staphylococcus ratti]